MRFVVAKVSCACGVDNRLILSPQGPFVLRCRVCHKPLMDYIVVSGYVYVLSNPGMPGQIKVGCTNGKVSDRVRQLSNVTAVPSEFCVEAYYFSVAPKQDEAIIHDHLKSFRIPRTEFFRLSIDVALHEITRMLGRAPDYHRLIHGDLHDI